MVTENFTNLSDEILLTRIHNGDDNALETLIKRYERLPKTIIYYEIHNVEAEKDIYQETVFAIVRRIRRRSDDIGSVEQWMKQVARSKCKAFLIDAKKQSIIRNAATADAVLSTTEEQVQSYIRDRCQEEHVIEIWKISEPTIWYAYCCLHYKKGLQNCAKTTDASDTARNTTLGGDDHCGVARQRRATGILSL